MAQGDRPITHPVFRFLVEIGGSVQAIFSECTLPSVEWEVLEVKEGGQNNYTHKLPGQRKGTSMTLKTGLGTAYLLDWYKECMAQKWQSRQVSVVLRDVSNTEVLRWNIQSAIPIKWRSPTLKTDGNTIAIEELELACGEVTLG